LSSCAGLFRKKKSASQPGQGGVPSALLPQPKVSRAGREVVYFVRKTFYSKGIASLEARCASIKSKMGGELRKQKLGEHSPGTRRSYPTSNLYIFFFLASNRPPTSRGTTNLSFRKRKLFVSKLGQILGGVSPLPWQGTTETVLRPTLCPGRSRALKKIKRTPKAWSLREFDY